MSSPTGVDVGVGAVVGVAVGVGAITGVAVGVDAVGVVLGIATVGGDAEAPQPARNAGSNAVTQSDRRRKAIDAFIALGKRRTHRAVTLSSAVPIPSFRGSGVRQRHGARAAVTVARARDEGPVARSRTSSPSAVLRSRSSRGNGLSERRAAVVPSARAPGTPCIGSEPPLDNEAVSECCSPAGYRWAFSEKVARRDARRYARKGLDSTSRRIVGLLTRRGVDGLTLLEIGGGVGTLQIELLKLGLARAQNIDITSTYEKTASELLRNAGLEDRVERKVMDFAEAGDDVEAADIVILNRVLCCYPDMPKLTAAASAHCRQVMVLSFPKDRLWTRAALAVGNLLLRATRRHFQVFVHRPERILAVAKQEGLMTTFDQPGRFWQVAALQRSE